MSFYRALNLQKIVSGLCCLCFFMVMGCSQINPFTKEEEGKRLCPKLAIHDLAQTNSVFVAGSKQDPIDLRYHVSFDDMQGECTLDAETIKLDITLFFSAHRGSAFEEQIASFDFVLAWVAPSGKVVFRDEFTHNFEFVDDFREVKLTRPYQNLITIPPSETAAQYSLIGALKIDKATLRSRLK